MKILLSADGSECSEGAAQFLTGLDLGPEDEITILHVVNQMPYVGNARNYYDTLNRIKQDIAPRIIESTANFLAPLGSEIIPLVEEGFPDKVIMETAVETGADMIVMGARGMRGSKSVFMGSVSRSVSLHSEVPVLITKPPQWHITGAMKVLLAVDNEEYADATAELLDKIPFHDDAELTIIHVTWSAISDIPERFATEVDERVKEMVAEARTTEFQESEKLLASLSGKLSERFAQVNVLKKVGDPSIEILEEAEHINADIVAVGSRGLRGIKGALDSVSRNIISHARCSVLIGRNHSAVESEPAGKEKGEKSAAT